LVAGSGGRRSFALGPRQQDDKAAAAEVGCHLTLASVARNVDDPHVVFVALNESAPQLDVHLRAAWRRDDESPALKAVLDELLAFEDAAPE
jgi:predicted kinase